MAHKNDKPSLLDRLRAQDGSTVTSTLAAVTFGRPRDYFTLDPETYIGMPTIASVSDERYVLLGLSSADLGPLDVEVQQRRLVLAITTLGNYAAWLAPDPAHADMSNSWNKSHHEAVLLGREGWVRVVPNVRLKQYEIRRPEAPRPLPDWDALRGGVADVLERALTDHFIDRADHPVLLGLRGVTRG